MFIYRNQTILVYFFPAILSMPVADAYVEMVFELAVPASLFAIRSFAFCWTGLMPPKSEYLAAGDASVGAWVHPTAHRRRLFLRV